MIKLRQFFCKHKYKSYVAHTNGTRSQQRKYYDDFELLKCEKCKHEKTRDL